MSNWFLSLLLLVGAAAPALGQRAIMEGVASTRYAIKIDTGNGRVDIATTSYSWGVANVGLHVASNVVVDSTGTRNAVVIYATGSIMLNGRQVSTSTVFSQISNSSCSLDLSTIPSFVVPAGFTTGLDTLTFTSDGINPVDVCYWGSANASGSSNAPGWSFLIDGSSSSAIIPTLNYSKGVVTVTAFSSGNLDVNISGCHRITAANLAAGVSHKYIITLGNGSAGNSIQPGAHAAPGSSEAMFCVTQVH